MESGDEVPDSEDAGRPDSDGQPMKPSRMVGLSGSATITASSVPGIKSIMYQAPHSSQRPTMRSGDERSS